MAQRRDKPLTPEQRQRKLTQQKARRAGTLAEDTYFHMSFEEIAKEMGVSKQRVHEICQTALKKLRVALKDQGFSVEDMLDLCRNRR